MIPLFACAAPEPTPKVEDSAPSDSGSAPVVPTEVAFRFVVVADSHVTGDPSENLDRLNRAVEWINAHAEEDDLELVLVVGDIGWGNGLQPAFDSLSALSMPWVPINGDNEVQLGSEEAYDTTFRPQYEALAGQLDEWTMVETPVEDPEVGATAWYHDLAFSFGGMRFVGLDWASRTINEVLGELGDLHDFDGGTWPFFVEQVEGAADGPEENVVMFSHIPMHFPMFDLDELVRMEEVTAPLADHLWADLAGHYHGSASETEEDLGFDLHVTDATWDDLVEVRIVEVRANDERFAPVTWTVDVDSE